MEKTKHTCPAPHLDTHGSAAHECEACGVSDCPFGEELHYHHDGCPSFCEDLSEGHRAYIISLRARVEEMEGALFELRRVAKEWEGDPKHRQYGEAINVWLSALEKESPNA